MVFPNITPRLMPSEHFRLRLRTESSTSSAPKEEFPLGRGIKGDVKKIKPK